jgi:predicted ATPase/DNA-binding SARP family transcriptional activator
MARLSISLLGPPKIAIDGVPQKITTHRVIPLLAYLAINGHGQTRETLANLLWSDSNLPHALASLRTTLWRLKLAGLEDWINLEQDEISLNNEKSIEVDAMEFKANIARCTAHGHPPSQICLYCIPALTEAAELYRGEFMSGFTLSKASAFDDWRIQEGEALYLSYLDTLERLIKGHRTFGDFNLAIQYARRLLTHDRYNENAQYDLLQLYSITGQRAAAINQYKRYKDFLARDLGIQPSQEITNLHKLILSGRAAPPVVDKGKTPIFLVADIEKADLLWAQPGARKADVISTLHTIFRETSKQFKGYILQKSEDSITVLFEKGQPLHFAVTIHLKLKKTDWGTAGPPNIRMVLYSTITSNESKNTFSRITRAAANLLSISWGGQILFSQETLNYLDRPPGSKFKDLGFHTLKDVREPIHVYEVLHPHLPTIEHPPLQSGGSQLINFPTHTPVFVGRETELKELADFIESPDYHIISLVGPGGVGKTRLALQFATQIASRFSDGAYFISLAPIHDPDLIPIVLADALKFSFYGPKNHTEQLGNYLHHMNALLVFDNFEHLGLEGAKFLAFLLSQTHHIKILVTTRERLNLISELVLEVHGLLVPPSETTQDVESYSAIRLFQQNARRISPRFTLEHNTSTIIRICQLVNGLPLGIILASSWVRVYNCLQIAEEIHKSIDFLESSAPDLPPRQRSLRAVFDNSWELLSTEERIILSRLSIFQVAFTSFTAQEICSASPLVLTTFLDKSLLYFQNERYEMLETFHQYAFGKLKSFNEEFTATRKKYIQYYVDFCLQKNLELNTSAQRQALDEMISEFENIRTAWTWMVECGDWDLIAKVKQSLLTYHVMTGNFIQGRELFRLALNKINNSNDPSLRLYLASIQQSDAWMTIRNGFITEGLQGLTSSYETFRLYSSTWEVFLSLLFLGDANRMLGNFRLAKSYIEDALQLANESDFPKSNEIIATIAHCKSILGVIFIEMGEYDQAHTYLKTSLTTHQRIGTHWGSIQPLQGLGKLAYLKGEFIQARDLYLQALETAEKIYDQRGMTLIHNNLSAPYEVIANPIESYQHILTALNLCKETGDRRLTALILNNLAYHQWRYLHRPSEAIRTYHESIEIFSNLGDLRGVAFSFYDISKAYLQVGLVDEARDYCLRSLQTAMTLDSLPLVLHALHGFINIYAHTKEDERALRLCNLIENHPQIEPDTQKRVIVSRAELEIKIPSEIAHAARQWAHLTKLQDTISQILIDHKS